MWSIGVLLYTLLFSENPFCGVEEILNAKLKPPFHISPGTLLSSWLQIVFIDCHIENLPIHFYKSVLKFLLCTLSDLHGVLCGLLHSDPVQRMTLDQLLLQSWISQPISLAEYSWTEVVPATQCYCEYLSTQALD